MNDRTDAGSRSAMKRKIGCFLIPIVIALVLLAVLMFMFRDVRLQGRGRVARNEQRVADLQRIKAALEKYVAEVGPLPARRLWRGGRIA
jgi:hypothetical protein